MKNKGHGALFGRLWQRKLGKPTSMRDEGLVNCIE